MSKKVLEVLGIIIGIAILMVINWSWDQIRAFRMKKMAKKYGLTYTSQGLRFQDYFFKIFYFRFFGKYALEVNRISGNTKKHSIEIRDVLFSHTQYKEYASRFTYIKIDGKEMNGKRGSISIGRSFLTPVSNLRRMLEITN